MSETQPDTDVTAALAELGQVGPLATALDAEARQAHRRRRELIIFLAGEKVMQKDIAAAAGMTTKAVEQVLYQARRAAVEAAEGTPTNPA